MQFDGIDVIGEQTLANISKAESFNHWMYDTIKPFVKGHLLEIGSGIGNISQYFLLDRTQTTLTDLRPNYCEILSEKFKGQPTLQAILTINLTHPRFEQEYAHLLNKYDSIVALNVVEHIADDKLALANCYKLLRPNGHVIILVPAYQSLYNKFDEGLEHIKRYTKTSLCQLITHANFEIIHAQYFNFVGIAGWFCFGSILKRENISENQMQLYDKLVPIIKLMDKLVLNKVGLSTVCIGKKK